MQPDAIEVYDSGLHSSGRNTAFDRAWLSLHAAGKRPAMLRFHNSSPAVSIGRHQALDRELRHDYCLRRNIEIVRRISGGGALYLDRNQQCLTLTLLRPSPWQGLEAAALLRNFCQGLMRGLAQLGLDVTFKAPNDLEVDGRKLASVFLATEGDTLQFFATILLDADIRTMLEVLRVPTEKLSPSGLDSARQRLATLKELLGSVPEKGRLQTALQEGLCGELGLEFYRHNDRPPLLPPEGNTAEFAHRIHWQTTPGDAQEAVWKSRFSTLRARVTLDAQREKIRHAEFAGDLHLHPISRLAELQQALAESPVAAAGDVILAFFRDHPTDMLGLTPQNLRHVLQLALDKFALRRTLDLEPAQANSLMVHSPDGSADAHAILSQATAMLVPYCAKPAWCKWRHEEDCVECGKCEVGDAYRQARERNMRVTTITNYEHLLATLAEMKAANTPAYVGMCCSNFFIKRHRAFHDSGIPAVLMDISGANCYELQQEDQAYAGTFQAEARIDTEVLRKVMGRVPVAAPENTPA